MTGARGLASAAANGGLIPQEVARALKFTGLTQNLGQLLRDCTARPGTSTVCRRLAPTCGARSGGAGPSALMAMAAAEGLCQARVQAHKDNARGAGAAQRSGRRGTGSCGSMRRG
jgi:hypothetical protein